MRQGAVKDLPEAEMEKPDTYVKFLVRNYQRWGDRQVAMRRKEYGIWEEYTWKDCYEKVKYFSLGLRSLGLQPGDKSCVGGDADPEWIWSQLAIMAAGAAAVGLFADSSPSEIKYIVEHSEAKFVAVNDQEQVDKFLEIKDELPNLKKVIYWDPKGLRDYADPLLMSFNQVIALGHNYEEEHPGLFEQGINAGKGDDLAMVYYTSGTTGLPKGVLITHHSLISTLEGSHAILPSSDKDDFVCILAPAWIAETMVEAGHLLHGMKMNYAEEPETVMQDLREISPVISGGGPRHWEGITSLIQVKVGDADFFTRLIYDLCLPIGYKIADAGLRGETCNWFWKALYYLADSLVFRPLRDKIGYTKTKYPVAGSAFLSPDILRYIHAIGLKPRQYYGSTEGGTVVGHQSEDGIRVDTIGPPVPGVEVRLSDDGELLVSSECLFSGYYKNPEATQKVLEGRWFHSGDACYINEEGHVIFLDRASELGQFASGEKYAPTYIEAKLRFSPYIRDAITIGGKDKEYLSVIIDINFDNVGKWAEKNRIPYTTFVDLSQKEEVAELVVKDIHRVNRVLPEAIKVKKFVLLHKEFDPDEAELTRTRKLRRGFFEDKYRELINGIYEGKETAPVEAGVTYRDGRKGTVKTALKIRTVGEE